MKTETTDTSRWTEAVRDDRTLNATAKLFAHVLATYFFAGEAPPSIPTLAAGMHRSKTTALKGCRLLEAAGYLEVTRAANPGRGDTHRYRLTLPEGALAPAASTPPEPNDKSLVGRAELNGWSFVRCPVCDCPWTHLVGVEFRACDGQPSTVVFEHGEDDPRASVLVAPAAYLSGCGPIPPSARRGALMLVFDCESGCRFGLTFEQHKGSEFIHLVPLLAWGEDEQAA